MTKADSTLSLTRRGIETLAVAVAYALLGKIGLSLAIPPGYATPVWPPSGLALAAVLFLGLRAAPGIWLGAFVVNISGAVTGGAPEALPASIAVALGIAIGSTVQPVLGSLLIRTYSNVPSPTFDVKDILVFAAITPLMCLASSTISVASLYFGGFVAAGGVGESWLTWWLGDSVGVLIVTPLLVAWRYAPDAAPDPKILLNLAVAYALLAVAGLFSFGAFWQGASVSYSLEFLTWPFLLWLALRHSQRAMMGGVLLLCAIAIGHTVKGHGPFVLEQPNHSLLLLQLFLTVSILTAYIVSALAHGHRRDEAKVREAMEREKVANRAKSNLLANMSHELRTPLNAIIGFSDSLKHEIFGPVGGPKNREYVDDIRTSANLLLNLINDILDVSAIEAGKLDLHEEDLDVSDVAATAIRLVRARIDEKNLRLELDMPAGGPRLRADRRRLKQILLNLLVNATKFTPDGGRIAVRSRLNDQGGIEIEVEDSGIGMDANGIAVALSQFGRVEPMRARDQEGAGLGLHLTNGLMGLHGGQLAVQSEVNKGTVVTARFPAARTVPHPARPASA